MKKMTYTLLFMLLVLSSCGSEAEWRGDYTDFNLSLTEYTFGVEGGSVTVAVEGFENRRSRWDLRWPWITNQYGENARELFPREMFPNDEEWEYHIRKWAGFIETFYIVCPYDPIRQIPIRLKTDWIEMVRDFEYDKIVFEVQPNTTGKERRLTTHVVYLGRSRAIEITQSAE